MFINMDRRETPTKQITRDPAIYIAQDEPDLSRQGLDCPASSAEARHSRALAESTAMPAPRDWPFSTGPLGMSLRVEEKLIIYYYFSDRAFEI